MCQKSDRSAANGPGIQKFENLFLLGCKSIASHTCELQTTGGK